MGCLGLSVKPDQKLAEAVQITSFNQSCYSQSFDTKQKCTLVQKSQVQSRPKDSHSLTARRMRRWLCRRKKRQQHGAEHPTVDSIGARPLVLGVGGGHHCCVWSPQGAVVMPPEGKEGQRHWVQIDLQRGVLFCMCVHPCVHVHNFCRISKKTHIFRGTGVYRCLGRAQLHLALLVNLGFLGGF